jgi:hypothetical protein
VPGCYRARIRDRAAAHKGLSMQFVPLVIAAGIGFWVYSDAKRLDGNGIHVPPFSPGIWGLLVFLVAIVFGIWYLVARPKAIAGT